jgi:BlaI family transcriptional regulator, penicillinase repressor
MGRKPADVTETELAMLEVIWRFGRATRRTIADALYPAVDVAHYATVQKLMQRLEEKGYVRHKREGGTLVYTARVDREQLLNQRLREIAERMCGGSVAPLVMNLVQSEPLSSAEIDELQAFLNEKKRLAQSKKK